MTRSKSGREKKRGFFSLSLFLWTRHNTSATAVRSIRNRCPRGDYPRRRVDAYDVGDSELDPERYRSGPGWNPWRSGRVGAFGLSLRACFEVVAGISGRSRKQSGANPIGKPAETNIEAGRLTEARV